MLTKKDVKDLSEIFATKKDLLCLEDRVNDKFSNLQTSVDGIAKLIKDERQERLMLKNKVDRHDGWIHEIADKSKVKLEY